MLQVIPLNFFIQKTRKNACSSSICRTIQPTKHCNLSAFWIGNNGCICFYIDQLFCLFSRQFMATRCSRNYIPSTEFSFYMCFRVLWILYDFLETLLLSTVRRFIRQFQTEKCHFSSEANLQCDWLPTMCNLMQFEMTTGHELEFKDS